MAKLLTAFDRVTFDVRDPDLTRTDLDSLNGGTITTLGLAHGLHPTLAALNGHADTELAKHGRRVMVALWKPAGIGLLVFPAHLDRPSDGQLARAFKKLRAARPAGANEVRCVWDEE